MKSKRSNNYRILFFIASISFVILISGCATPSVYKEVLKDKPAYNSKEFPVSNNVLYQTVINVICAKNFIIESEDQAKGFILAKRYFQKGKRNIVFVLQTRVVSNEENKATLYLNALQTSERLYVADRTRFFLWLIPLPGGGGKEATKVKEEEKIVEDKEFYQGFFTKIEDEIKNTK